MTPPPPFAPPLPERAMTREEHQRAIDELESLITETRETLWRFEEADLCQHLADDYATLQDIMQRAVEQQAQHRRLGWPN